MGDPLDFRDVLVLHRREPCVAIQVDVAEVLQAYLLPFETLKVVACDLDPGSSLEDPLPATREFGMDRGLHRSDGRQAVDVDRDGVGDAAIAVRLFVDAPAVLR